MLQYLFTIILLSVFTPIWVDGSIPENPLPVPETQAPDTIYFSDDFERGITGIDAPVGPGDSVIVLTPNGLTDEWKTADGIGVLDCSRSDGQRDDFTYTRRTGCILYGVKGLKFSHPEGTDIRTNGLDGFWRNNPDEQKGRQNGQGSPITGGFGVDFYDFAPGILKALPSLRHVYVRFYLRVDTLVAKDSSPMTRISIHTLQPDFLGIMIKLRKNNLVKMEFSNWAGSVCSTFFPMRSPVCVEYEMDVDTMAMKAGLHCWIEGEPLPPVRINVPPELKRARMDTLSFFYAREEYPLFGAYRIDDILCASRRIGPKAASGAFRILAARDDGVTLPGGFTAGANNAFFIPVDTAGITGYEVQVSDGFDWRFPYLSRKVTTVFSPGFAIKHSAYNLENAVMRSRIRRIGTDWSSWSYIPLSVPTLPKDTARPSVDSCFIIERGQTVPTDTLAKGRIYDLFFYVSDPHGWSNLFYNYIILNNALHPESNIFSQGGVFDPKGNYFISCSIGDTTPIIYIHDKPGTNHLLEVPKKGTLYVTGAKNYLVVDSLKKRWITNVRLLPEAATGTWLFQTAVFNRNETPSYVLRKKITVIDETRWPLYAWALIILGICLVPAGWLLYRRRKKNRPLVSTPPEKLDYRVKIALDHIKGHFVEDISVNQIATAANANPNWLGKQFKKEVGQDIRNFINQLRCEKAAELLAENKLNISQIGYKVGFNNSEYFNQVFRKHYQKSPSQYRKEIMSQPE